MEKSREAMTASRSSWLTWIIVAGLLGGLLYLFPLFRLIPLASAQKQKVAETFDPKRFAEEFWSEKLLQSLDKAVPAEAVLSAIQNNPGSVRKKFGRTLGMSESYTLFISGTGNVLSVTDDEVSLALTPGVPLPEIVLQTGLLFGNALRDGPGLLDVND